MSDQNQHNDFNIEELLAAYAEQIADSSNPGAVPQSDQPALKQLQETAYLLSRPGPDSPPPEQAEQIKNEVLKAYQKRYQSKPTLIEKLRGLFNHPARTGYQSAARRRQLAVIRITAAAVLVIIAAFVILPTLDISGGTAVGTAIGNSETWTIIGSILLLAGFGLWWWLGTRRK
jgi:hypothetical protein